MMTPDDGGWFIKCGTVGGHRIICVFAPDGVRCGKLAIAPGFFPNGNVPSQLTDLVTDRVYPLFGDQGIGFQLDFGEWGIALLTDAPAG